MQCSINRQKVFKKWKIFYINTFLNFFFSSSHTACGRLIHGLSCPVVTNFLCGWSMFSAVYRILEIYHISCCILYFPDILWLSFINGNFTEFQTDEKIMYQLYRPGRSSKCRNPLAFNFSFPYYLYSSNLGHSHFKLIIH